MKDRLVLRLKHPLLEAATEQLSREFRDLLSAGAIQQGRALPEEADEPLLQDLPRLIFRFNRKNYGRLVQLIHRVNDHGATGDK